MDDSIPVEEVLHLLAGEHLCSIRCERDRDAKHTHVPPECLEELLAGVLVKPEYREPVAKAVHYGKEVVGVQCEEVSTYRLERVYWCFWHDWWHGRVGGLIPAACGTGCSEIDYVGPEVRPVQGSCRTFKHFGSTLVSGMEVLEYCLLESLRNDRPVMQEDDWTSCYKRFSVCMKI